MDIDAAISEPLARHIEFHNTFNTNMKVSFGALALASEQSEEAKAEEAVTLPTGAEPWGRETRWRKLDDRVRDAAVFLAELGIARVVAAFEDYAIGAKAEFDRAMLRESAPKRSGCQALHGFDAIVGLDPAAVADLGLLAGFFDVARNCVVHRSNRANAQLATLRADPALATALTRLPRRVGKWAVSLPPVEEGSIVAWRPRHAILASDVSYRSAVALDRSLVGRMGPGTLAGMAAHWAFFANPAAPCPAKHSPEIMVRSQLTDRYKVRGATLADTVALLREAGRWDAVRAAWDARYPNGPETTLARRRRARRS